MYQYGIAKTFTPILNTDKYKEVFGGQDGKTLPLQNGLLKAVETIALPQSTFLIKGRSPFDPNIVCVESTDYPYPGTYYVDTRFLSLVDAPPYITKKTLPPLSTILDTMRSFLGAPYVWGGNCPSIPEMLHYYPPSVPLDKLDPVTRNTWRFQGMDCSGLLFYASNGMTPRNTSSLVHYGIPVLVSGLPLQDWNIKPGDLIVWKGHVIIVSYDRKVIESLHGKGVIETPFEERINTIVTEYGRKPSNEWVDSSSFDPKAHFVIRRWHQDVLS